MKLKLILLFSLACSLGAQTASLLPVPKAHFVDANGIPLAGGQVWTYAAGTTTPLTTYTSASGAVANTNPVLLDAGGFANIWLKSGLSYKIVVQDQFGVTQFTTDNVGTGIGPDATLVNYTVASTGGVQRTLASKLGDTLSVRDFGADATGATSSNPAFTLAFNAATARGGGRVLVPPGTYTITTPLLVPSNVTLACDAGGATITNTVQDGAVLSFAAVTRAGVTGCALIASNGTPVVPTAASQGDAISITGGSSYIVVENSDISGYEWAGVEVNNGNFLRIAGNKFHDGAVTTGTTANVSPSDITAWGPMNDSLITGNQCLSFNDFGINISPPVASTSAYRNVLELNTIQNKNVYGIILYTLAPSNIIWGTIIRANRISNISSRVRAGNNWWGEGIYSAGADYTIIEDNIIDSVLIGRVTAGSPLPWGAISLNGGNYTAVKHNTITNSRQAGIQAYSVLDAKITGNTINSPADDGITISTGMVAPMVDGNTVNSAANIGIRVVGIANVKLLSNTVRGGASTGVLVDAASPGAMLILNLVENNVGRGMLLAASDLDVGHNVVRNNNYGGAGTNAGIVFSSTGTAQNIRVIGNETYDNQATPTQRYGITVDSSYSQVRLIGNISWGNVTGQYSIVPTGAFDSLGNSNMADNLPNNTGFGLTNPAYLVDVFKAGASLSGVQDVANFEFNGSGGTLNNKIGLSFRSGSARMSAWLNVSGSWGFQWDCQSVNVANPACLSLTGDGSLTIQNNLTLPAIHSTSGTLHLCVDTAGHVSACS